MIQRIIDPKKQFSKKLARWTAVFWFAYMSWLSAIMVIEPVAALYTVYMGLIVSVVMIINVWAYTKNSVYEKACFAMLDKARIEIGLNNSANKEDSGHEEDLKPEEESNG